MEKKFRFIYLLICFSLPCFIPAQEALKSAEEEYYDFLALQGLTERPSLNYRTLSDSVWNLAKTEEHPWKKQDLDIWNPLFGKFKMRAYGPELFMSGNTAAPYGQNDGLLWQGRGFNALLKGGVRFEGYGVELTLLPHFAFSQNTEFNFMPAAFGEYGYFWGYGVDAPQRFGDKPFFDWDFGDSEIRYTWKTLTVGFGTQAIWLGPANLNPILHSNNAPAYPKFDIGLRRQKIIIPKVGWYLGDVETRLWVGCLSESDFFDNDELNNYTMFHGFSFAYAPSFLSGLTLFVNRVCLVPWEWENLKFIVPVHANTIEDQKISFGISWVFSPVGLEIYGEVGIDDFIPEGKKIVGYLRDISHTTVYTTGLRKVIEILPDKDIYGELMFEFNWMEMSQDFQFQWPYSFYFHHQVTHGFTNKGQWLGNGLGSGGNSQHLSFVLYYPKGSSSFFIQRNNPDNDYLYKNAVNDTAESGMLAKNNKDHNKANFNIGIATNYFITRYFSLSGGTVYNMIINPLYKRTKEADESSEKSYAGKNVLQHNFSFQLGLKFII